MSLQVSELMGFCFNFYNLREFGRRGKFVEFTVKVHVDLYLQGILLHLYLGRIKIKIKIVEWYSLRNGAS